MIDITLNQFITAGVHFGHRLRSLWCQSVRQDGFQSRCFRGANFNEKGACGESPTKTGRNGNGGVL